MKIFGLFGKGIAGLLLLAIIGALSVYVWWRFGDWEARAISDVEFMDRMMALPGVIHIGAETSSDTQYIDVRRVELPSQTGRLYLPLKVYRERLRPSGGTFVPQIETDPRALDWDAVEALLSNRGE